MKTNEKYGAYEALRVEVIEVGKGFATSPDLQNYNYKGHLNNGN